MSDMKELLFTLKDIRDSNFTFAGNQNNKSIFQRAKPSILQFPVLVSDNISLEDLTMVNKALEREYSTVVRLAMGLDDIIDGSHGAQSKIDYIKKFHSNDYSSDNKGFNEIFESINKEYLLVSEETDITEYSNKKALRESLGINMANLNDFTNKNDNQYINLSEARVSTRKSKSTKTTSDEEYTINGPKRTFGFNSSRTDNNINTYTVTRNGNGGNGRNGNGGNGRNGETRSRTRTNPGDNYSTNNGVTYNFTDRNDSYKSKGSTTVDDNKSSELTFDTITAYSDYRGQLVDNDIKKANELIPTTLDITVYQVIKHDDGEETIVDHILLGIKCIAHKVSSREMIENIQLTINNKKALFRFIQWTTGEIKFFKDYLLCLDMLKKEALNSSHIRNKNGNSAKWFRELKNKANISRLRSTFNLKDQLIPNTTLVFSMDEVDYLKNMYKIDLLNDLRLAQRLMNLYFLIGIVIVDSSAEIAYFKFDGFEKYQMFTFNSLERENRNQGNDIKALVSLMNKY